MHAFSLELIANRKKDFNPASFLFGKVGQWVGLMNN